MRIRRNGALLRDLRDLRDGFVRRQPGKLPAATGALAPRVARALSP